MPDMNAAYAQLQQNATQSAQAEQAEMDPLIAQAQGMINKPRPQTPQLQQPPQAPQNNMAQGMWQFLTAANVLGALAGAFSSQHATTALNAFAAAVDGFRQGKADVAAENVENWKNATEQTIQSNKTVTDEYQRVLADRKMSIDEKMDEIQLIAIKYKDTNAMQLAQMKDFVSLERLVQQNEIATQRLQLSYDQLQQKADEAVNKLTGTVTATQTYMQKNPPPPNATPQQMQQWSAGFKQWLASPEGQQATQANNQTVGGYTDESLRQLAKQAVQQGDRSGSQIRGYGTMASTVRGKLQQYISEEMDAQKITPEQMSQRQLEWKSRTSGATVVGRTAGNVAVGAAEIPQLVPKITEIAKRLNKSEYPSVNAVENAIKRGTGNADVVQLNSYIQTLKNAYQQIAARGGRITDQVRNAGEALISGNMPINQLSAAAQAMVTEAGIVKGATREAIGDISGGNQPPPALGGEGWKMEPVH